MADAPSAVAEKEPELENENPNDALSMGPLEIEIEAPASGSGGGGSTTVQAKSNEAADALRQQLAASEGRNSQLEQRARQSEAIAAQEAIRASQASVAMIDSAIDAAKQSSEQIKAKMVQALDAADHKTYAELNEQLADERLNLRSLEQQKVSLEVAPAPRRVAPVVEQRSEADKLADHVSSQGYRKSGDWIRAHPELTRDIQKLDTAHRMATQIDGLAAESDDYFARVEEILSGKRPAADFDPVPRAAPRAAAAVSAARPTSDAPSLATGAGRPMTITLTPAQRDAARAMGMTDKEYATELYAAQQAGKINGGRGAR